MKTLIKREHCVCVCVYEVVSNPAQPHTCVDLLDRIRSRLYMIPVCNSSAIMAI